MTDRSYLTAVSSSSRAGRALATVETVTALRDIPDADNIVCARIRGWDVVVKRGEFSVGDLCVYFEVDSLLDVTDDRFAFLAPRGVRTDQDGRTGHVLKTARLRGQYSQGLALPVAEFAEVADVEPGTDVTGLLSVVKWDPPIPANLAGKVRGMRPSWIPSTDEQRIQNFAEILDVPGLRWQATEKIDGMSTSYFVDPEAGWSGVCTRNLDLLSDDNNTMWRLAREHRIHESLAAEFPGQRVAVQGETYGDGIIKGNPLRLRGQHFAAFTLLVDGVEVPRGQWPMWLQALSVPERNLTFPTSLEDALAQVENLKSALAPDRAAEGIVWRAADQATVALPSGQVVRASVKVISNRYLIKNDR